MESYENLKKQKEEILKKQREKTDLIYTFEEMVDGDYQVRLCGEFVCYSNHTDEKGIDESLKQMGFESRVDFLSYRLSQYRK